jgi:hypothetical protein
VQTEIAASSAGRTLRNDGSGGHLARRGAEAQRITKRRHCERMRSRGRACLAPTILRVSLLLRVFALKGFDKKRWGRFSFVPFVVFVVRQASCRAKTQSRKGWILFSAFLSFSASLR